MSRFKWLSTLIEIVRQWFREHSSIEHGHALLSTIGNTLVYAHSLVHSRERYWVGVVHVEVKLWIFADALVACPADDEEGWVVARRAAWAANIWATRRAWRVSGNSMACGPVMSEKLIVVVLVRGEEKMVCCSFVDVAGLFWLKVWESTKLSVCVVIPVYK